MKCQICFGVKEAIPLFGKRHRHYQLSSQLVKEKGPRICFFLFKTNKMFHYQASRKCGESYLLNWLPLLFGRLFGRCFQNVSLSQKLETLAVRKSRDDNLKDSTNCPENADLEANVAALAQHLLLFCPKLIIGLPYAPFYSSQEACIQIV